MGSNCAVRAAFRTPDPVNGLDRWYVVWEIRNPGDEHSQVIITYIGENFGSDWLKRQTEEDMLVRLRKAVQPDASTTYYIVTKKNNPTHKFENPVLTEMIDNANDYQQEKLDKLYKTHKIPDELSEFPIWLKDVIRTN
jgi:hypothetical protein